MAFLQVLFYLSFSPIFGHFRFDSHFHVDLRINLYRYSILPFDNLSSCEDYFASDFSRSLLLVGNGSSDAPKLFALLKNVPRVYKISGCYDKDLMIRQIDNLSVVVW